MSAGITLDACVSTRVRTPLGPTIALVLLVSACLTMGSIVKVPDIFFHEEETAVWIKGL